MVGGYEVVDHPSDLSVRAFGPSLEETFKETAIAMWNIMKTSSLDERPFGQDWQDLGGKAGPKELNEKREVILKSKALESLLVDFLNEQIFLCDSEDFVVDNIPDLTVSPSHGQYVLVAVLEGRRVPRREKILWLEIKAATYHGIKVTPFSAEVTFDV